MVCSEETDTVLVSDWVGGRVFERSSSGAFLRSFNAPVSVDAIGLPRGQNNEVLAVSFQRSSVFRWRAAGALSLHVPGPTATASGKTVVRLGKLGG